MALSAKMLALIQKIEALTKCTSPLY